MASTYLRWLGERGWTMRLTPGGALFAGVDDGFERGNGIGDEELEHAVELAVVKIDA